MAHVSPKSDERVDRDASSVGQLLRRWRERRGLSQLALSVEAEVSARHLSFVETGRARPSREMVLLLALFVDAAEVAALGHPNAIRLFYHPRGMRPFVRNWEATAAALVQWLHRDVLRGAGRDARTLLDEILSYPDVPASWRRLDLDAPAVPVLTVELQRGDVRASFFSTLTTLGVPYDITLHELRVECLFPADAGTEALMQKLAAQP